MANAYEEDARGRQAKELLENAMFREAMDSLRDGIITKWRGCPIRDLDGQHELKLMDKLLIDIEAYLKVIIDTGKMAEIQLSRESKITELKKHGIR
jgi:hypothetical protein